MWLLVHFYLDFLSVFTFITAIACAVQLVEIFVKNCFLELFRQLGIDLPLITTNCAVLGVALFQTARNCNFAKSLAYSIAGGIGFTLAHRFAEHHPEFEPARKMGCGGCGNHSEGHCKTA
jgi:electron transport complex protein RnfA